MKLCPKRPPMFWKVTIKVSCSLTIDQVSIAELIHFNLVVNMHVYNHHDYNYLQGIVTSYMRHQNTYLYNQAIYEIKFRSHRFVDWNIKSQYVVSTLSQVFNAFSSCWFSWKFSCIFAKNICNRCKVKCPKFSLWHLTWN